MNELLDFLLKLVIFIAGGSVGALVMAIFAAGAQRTPSPLLPKHCRRCGTLYYPEGVTFVSLDGCARCAGVDHVVEPARAEEAEADPCTT